MRVTHYQTKRDMPISKPKQQQRNPKPPPSGPKTKTVSQRMNPALRAERARERSAEIRTDPPRKQRNAGLQIGETDARGRTVVAITKNGRRIFQAPGESGRPVFSLDEKEQFTLYNMMAAGIPLSEVAKRLHHNRDQIREKYPEIIEEAINDRNIGLRLRFYQKMQDNDLSAMIWLSKQWLGWTDSLKLGNDPNNPMPGSTSTQLIEVVFVESDGDGRPKKYPMTDEAFTV